MVYGWEEVAYSPAAPAGVRAEADADVLICSSVIQLLRGPAYMQASWKPRKPSVPPSSSPLALHGGKLQ